MAAFLAGIPFCLRDGACQENNFSGWDSILNSSYLRNPDRQVLRSFRLPESWDAERKLKKARDHIKDKEYSRAILLLHDVIENHKEQVFQVAIDALDSTQGLARFVGAAEMAHYILFTMPMEGLDAYAAFASEKADHRVEEAVQERDLDLLAGIGETFSAAPTGQNAFSLLAALYLEQGDNEMALLYLEKIRLFQPDPDPIVLQRLAQALDQLGREEESRACIDRLKGAVRDEAQLHAFAGDLEETPVLRESPPWDWPACGGTSSRTRPMPFIADTNSLSRQWGDSFLNDLLVQADPFYGMSSTTGAVPFRLLRSGEILILNDTVSTMAFNIYTGEKLWHFRGPLESLDDKKDFFRLEDYLSFQDGYGFSRSSTASTISSHLLAGGTIAKDKVLVNLHDTRRRQEAKYLDRQIINKAIPQRSLFALTVEEGKRVWAQDASATKDFAAGEDSNRESDFLQCISIASPPVVFGDHVVCNGFLREGGINTFILCFDLESGALVWKMPVGIGQHELTMFNMEYKEFTTTPLSGSEGVVVFCSNLGFVAALDALSGRIRWVAEYNTIPLPEATHFTGRPNPRPVYWANNPPVICDNRVVVTPLDSDSIFAYDLHTGKPAWKQHAQRLGTGTYPNVLGAHDGKVILCGGGGAVALSAENGSRQWRVFLPADQAVSGRGAMTEDRLFLPAGGNLYIYELNSGKAAGRLGVDYSHYPSNLFLLGEVIASVETEYLQLYFDGPGMLDQALTRLEQGNNQAVDMAFIGDMYRLNGTLEKAISFYKKAMATDDSDPSRNAARLARIKSCLFKASLDYGKTLAYAGREEEALANYRYAFESASGPDRIVQAGLAMIDLLEFMGQADPVRSVLGDLLNRCADCCYDFAGVEGLETAPVGFYVRLKRYHM
ncbi:MAG: PQQ-binding-like beta-propeller repeat protein, partial [Planctomycetota bacterium]